MTFEVQSFNMKSRSTITKLAIVGFLTVMGLFLLLSIPNQRDNMIIPVILLGTILTLSFPLLLAVVMTSKVIFDKDKVTRVSMFGRKEISINDLKSYGTFIQSRYSSRLVDSDELNENEMIDSNMIFLSESSTFDLNKFKLPVHIRLEYRADVYQRIKEWVKQPAHNKS